MILTFREEAESLRDTIVSIRRKIHENPELGFQEYETAKLIKEKLDELGIQYTSEIAKTGIFASIHGQGDTGTAKSLLIRADMDALPLVEDADLEFKSKKDEVFHACGHDTHVATVLGAAEILQNNRDKFAGTVNFVFQPAEEGSKLYDPSGKIAGGALPMIQEAPQIFGSADDPKFDGILALHITAGKKEQDQVGKIGVKDGEFTGSADEFYITIKGEGGHASSPHTAVDPVYIASQAYIAVQGLITRIVDPMEPVVFTIGKIKGGFRQNIISETCTMEGTLRTLNSELRDMLKEQIPKTIKLTAQAYGGDADVTIFTGYPVGINSGQINEHIKKVTTKMYGEDAIIDVPAQLGAEDYYEFGFKNAIPISMFWLGGANREKGWTGTNHSNYFRIDEDALPMGTAILASAAVSFLRSD